MAKVKVTGNAVVVISELTLEAINTIQKYRPKALTLLGGENGKEPIFRISATSGEGDINCNGASFGCATHDAAKKACISFLAPNMGENVKEWVADKLGGALINLGKLEEALPEVLQQITAEKAAVMENIVTD